MKERSDIMGILARAEHEFQESEADAKHEYSSIRDDVKNKVICEKL
jgi:dynein regulatory complex subunit 2